MGTQNLAFCTSGPFGSGTIASKSLVECSSFGRWRPVALFRFGRWIQVTHPGKGSTVWSYVYSTYSLSIGAVRDPPSPHSNLILVVSSKLSHHLTSSLREFHLRSWWNQLTPKPWDSKLQHLAAKLPRPWRKRAISGAKLRRKMVTSLASSSKDKEVGSIWLIVFYTSCKKFQKLFQAILQLGKCSVIFQKKQRLLDH